jgi:hypothetical protein
MSNFCCSDLCFVGSDSSHYRRYVNSEERLDRQLCSVELTLAFGGWGLGEVADLMFIYCGVGVDAHLHATG